MSRSDLKSTMTEFYRLLEEQGPTLQTELQWLDLRANIGRDDDSVRAWYHLGYLILDRKKNFGVALRYLISSAQGRTASVADHLRHWKSVFIYAASSPTTKQKLFLP